MKFNSRFLSVALAQTLLVAQPSYAAETDEVIVQLREGVGAHSQSLLGMQTLGAVALQKVPDHGNVVLLKKQAGISMDELLRSLRGRPEVLFAESNVEVNIPDPEPDAVYSAAEAAALFGLNSVPNDPLLTWGYEDIQADQTPPAPANGPLVAVIDTGVDYTHPELAGRVVLGKDFHNDDNDPMDDHGHGTHVSGIIAATANNGAGSAGISPTSRILALKALGGDGSGSGWNVTQAIYAAADNPDVKIISMSLGSVFGSVVFRLAIEYATQEKGKLVVVAAGNSNTSNYYYPATWSHYVPGVVGVAANDEYGCKAWFSNYGINSTIAAPGVSILSTLPNNHYAAWSGTSMATPFVAGAAARILAEHPGLSNFQVKAKLEGTGDPLIVNGNCWPSSSYYLAHLNLPNVLDLDVVPPPVDTVPPEVAIQSPTNGDTYETNESSITVAGIASDDSGIDRVTWKNNHGDSGQAEGTTSWSISEVPLWEGENVITLTACDIAGNEKDQTLRVTRISGDTVAITVQLKIGDDDGYEALNRGLVYLGRWRAPLGKNGLLGYHFEGVPVPAGATIVSARLHQYIFGLQNRSLSLSYSAEASGDAAPFTAQRYDLSARGKTLESVTEFLDRYTWTPSEFNPSPDLKNILQEIVSRSDWQSGNAVNVFVEDQGSEGNAGLNQFEHDPSWTAQLEIEYRLP